MERERLIVHMDLDTFFVSVERLKDARLINKPVVVGGTGDRGVVASCSYEARAFGVHSAMPMRQARMLCPEVIVVRGDYEHYSYYSNMVTEIVEEKVPLYAVSYTHLRAHETVLDLVCRLLLETKTTQASNNYILKYVQLK